jgi:hypothetical protein
MAELGQRAQAEFAIRPARSHAVPGLDRTGDVAPAFAGNARDLFWNAYLR